jgi:hypothetical protein
MAPIPPIPTPARDVPGVLALLQRQRDLYQQLHALAQRQGPLVDAGEPELLLPLLAQRQRYVDELGRSSAALQPHRARWDEVLAGLAPAARQQVGKLTQEIARLRDAVMAQDHRDCKLLDAARGQVGREVAQIAQAGRALGAYRTPTAGRPPRFTDRQG